MENQTNVTNEMTNMTRHMYQDGNDLVIVYTNVFNSNYNLENMIRAEILKPTFTMDRSCITDITPLLDPLDTPTIPAPKIVEFGYMEPEKYHKFISLGGQTQKEDGTRCNYVTTEELARKMETELGIKRKA